MLYSTHSLITKFGAWSNRIEQYIYSFFGAGVAVSVFHRTVLKNLSVYLSYTLKRSNLVEELLEYKLKKIPNIMLFALVLRNTYISSYKTLVENFPFPSLLLEKISSGATDTAKCQQNAGKIYDTACLWKYFARDRMFQFCQFSKKLLQYCIAIRRQQRIQLSHCKVCCRENQEKSQLLLSWNFGGWFSHQLKSRLSVHENLKEERTYYTISRLCKLFMYKLCDLRFFFWSNIEISFTFANSRRTYFESWG